MKICMIVNNMNEFGGLEDFAKNLAVEIQRQGHEVLFFSTFWIRPDNQYLRELRANNIRIGQLPKLISLLVADWDTRLKILSYFMVIFTPVIYLLGLFHYFVIRSSYIQSLTSARNWLRGQLLKRVFFPDRRKPFVLAILNWIRLVWKPDLLHIQGYTNSLLYIIDWAHSKNLPVVYEEHTTPDAGFDWWKDFNQSINKASVVVAVSEKSADALRDICGVTQPIKVAYCMVPDPVEAGLTAEHPEKHDHTITISTFARLYVAKGLTYLLEAIVQVLRTHPEAQFRIYGDGQLRGELLQYAEELGLDGKQIFAGVYKSREDLTNIIAQTDIFAMSSIFEGLPLALLEAMSYGLPVVVTSVGGIPEVIEDGVNGLLCPPRDPDQLAEKICLLIDNPDLRKQLGQKARISYEQGRHHPIKVSKQYIAIYQEVLADTVKLPV